MPHLGCITPSRFGNMMSHGQKKDELWGKTAMSYAYELAMNREFGVYKPDLDGVMAIEHGNMYEIYAIQAYEERNITQITPVTEPMFHPELPYVCGEPDGLIGTDGLVEIKCPFNPLNHLSNLLDASQDKDYRYQTQGYLWITGRKWYDFVSYSPEYPEPYHLAVHRFERDEAIITELYDRVVAFEAIVQGVQERIRGLVL
jgi:hypothetical protein